MTKEQLQAAEEFLHAAADVVENAESSLLCSVKKLRLYCQSLCEKNEMDGANKSLAAIPDLPIFEQVQKLEIIVRFLLKMTDDEVSSMDKLNLNLRMSETKAREKVYTVMTSLDWLSYCYPNEKTNSPQPDARKDVW